MIPLKIWSRFVMASIIGVLLITSSLPVLADQLTVYAYRDFSNQGMSAGSWAARVNFSAPVFLVNLKQAIKVLADGREIDCDISMDGDQNQGKSSRTFIITPKRINPLPSTISLTIHKGLTDLLGNKTLVKPFIYEFQSVEQISVNGLETYFRSTSDRGIKMLLSGGSVTDKDLRNAIKIDPGVPDLKIRRNDEGAYEISGNFVKDQNYTIQILQIPTKEGTAVFAQNEFQFLGPGLSREIAFQSENSIVELRSRQFVPVRLSGVPQMRCELSKIPPILITQLARDLNDEIDNLESYLDSWRTAIEESGFDSKNNCFAISKVQEDKEVFFAPDASDKSVIFSAPMSFRKFPEKGGAWIVKLGAPDNSDVSPATRLIQITDLAISYKLSTKSLLLWVTSLQTGEPVPGVDLAVVTKDEEAFDIGKSDENGLIMTKDRSEFVNFKLDLDKTPSIKSSPLYLENISWLIAANTDDYCAVDIESFKIKPTTRVPEDKTEKADGAKTGLVFTDRAIYRPGDEVHFKFISRIFKDNKIEAPEKTGVKIQVIGPRGDVYYSREQPLNQFGSCWDTLKLETYWPVGSYTIQTVFSDKAADKNVFTKNFSVQEYRESRHYVSLTFHREQKPLPKYVGVKGEEEFLLTEITSTYFAGGPVRHGKVRWKADLAPVTNSVAGHETYFFGNQEEQTLFLESGESILDEQGKLSVKIPLDVRLLTGIYGVRLSATVVDIDGQPATEVKFFNPAPRFLVGILANQKQVQVGYSSPLRFVLVDSEGKRVPKALMEMAVLQKRYLNVKKRDRDGNINDNWEEGWMKTFSTTQTIIDGEGSFQPEFVDPGDYLVSITFLDTTGRYSSQVIFKVGWDDYDQWLQGQKKAEKGSTPDIMISLNQKEYSPGSTIEASFHAPRAIRRCLMTLERSDILDHQVVEVNGRDGGAKFLIQNGFQPNIFVSLLAPTGRSDFPVYSSQTDSDIPTMFSGYAKASVKTELKKLNLDIDKGLSEIKAKPGEKVKINLAVSDQSGSGVVAEMAVCVVNEAVLAMADFNIPDLSPLANFDLPLSVKTGDLRLGLISQDLFRMLNTRPLTGGGAGKAMMGPSFRKDFRPVAYFNPSVVTNEKGQASITFVAPDSLTVYRVYAVATDRSSGFVSADRPMTVNKDFYAEPSIPRFLCPGDEAILPVRVFNNTKENGKISLELNVSPNMKIEPKTFKSDLSGNSSVDVGIHTKVGEQSDNTWLEITAAFDSKIQKLDDAVRKTIPTKGLYSPLTKIIQGGFAGNIELPVVFPKYVEKFISPKAGSKDVAISLTLSLHDWSRITPGLKYLMHYPFGCIEQISSSVIPLVGLRDLIASGQISELSGYNVEDFLKTGIDKILGSQQLTGGFSYWPGQLDTTLWASSYATFALITASKAGMKVPESSLNLASKFLKESVFKKDSSSSSYRSKSDLYWMLFTLAELGAIVPQDLQPFFNDYRNLSEESKSLLLMASKKINYLNSTRQKELARKLAPSEPNDERDALDSPWRELAACLMATLEIEGHSKKADEFAGKLLKGLRPDGAWISTADTGWCLLALSRYFREKGNTSRENKSINLTLDLGEKDQLKLNLKEAARTIEINPSSLLNSRKIILKADSSQFVNYNLSLKYPEDPTEEETKSRGLSLSKKISNLNGNKEIKVGDMVRISLEIGFQDSSYKPATGKLDFLALEDFTPAGLTPINSELKTEGMDEEGSINNTEGRDAALGFYPSYVEIRDDGVRVFKNRIYSGTYRFSYLARAVTAGNFWMRGSRISAMYDPRIKASTPGKKIRILGPSQ